MAKLANVIQFNSNNDENIYGTIITFLKRKGQNSLKTRETYERHIKDFFKTMRNKDIQDLVEQDIIFTKKQIISYQVSLKEQYKGTTVNNAISAIRECYKRLEDDGYNVSASWFDLERYDGHDKESYDTLTHDEVVKIIDLVSKTRKGAEKALLIRLAYATAFRKESLLTMKWSQIIDIDGVWYAKVLGKGNKWSHKKISHDLYASLMAHKVNSKGEKIFELTHKTVNKMMNHIRENIDFGERRIVFHSFKKASINEVNAITGGDIKAMQSHGDHADARTTINDYLAKKNLEELVEVDINKKIPVEKFEELTKEQLVELLMSTDRNTQIKLLRQMGEI